MLTAILCDSSADGTVSAEDDEKIRMLLHSMRSGSEQTNEELLQENPEEYGKVCCGLGYLYRYGCEGGDGERISAGWFSRAVENASRCQNVPEWLDAASLYAQEAEIWSMQDEQGWTGDEPGEESSQEETGSWEKLCRIWESKEEIPQALQEKFYLEVSENLAAHAAFWPEQGIAVQDIREKITQVKTAIVPSQQKEQMMGDTEKRSAILENLDIAEELLEHRMTEGEEES